MAWSVAVSDKFEIDQPCMCIIGGQWFTLNDEPSKESPVEGKIYMVKDITKAITEKQEVVVLKLYELPWDRWYFSEGFRPCRKTSIEIFTSMLAPTPKKTKEKELGPVTLRIGDKHYSLKNFTVKLPGPTKWPV